MAYFNATHTDTIKVDLWFKIFLDIKNPQR